MTNMINCSRKKHKKICKMCYAFIKVIISRKQDNPIISIHTQFRSLFVRGFPRGSLGKESAWNLGDLGLIPGLGRSPGEGKGYPCQHSGLENSVDHIVHEAIKSQTQLIDVHFHISLVYILELMKSVWPPSWSFLVIEQCLACIKHSFSVAVVLLLYTWL